jgi:hypothetical protein
VLGELGGGHREGLESSGCMVAAVCGTDDVELKLLCKKRRSGYFEYWNTKWDVSLDKIFGQNDGVSGGGIVVFKPFPCRAKQSNEEKSAPWGKAETKCGPGGAFHVVPGLSHPPPTTHHPPAIDTIDLARVALFA